MYNKHGLAASKTNSVDIWSKDGVIYSGLENLDVAAQKRETLQAVERGVIPHGYKKIIPIHLQSNFEHFCATGK